MSCVNSEFCHLWRTRNDRSQRRVLDEFHLFGLHQVGMMLDEVGVNVPRVPALGLVDERLQQVASRALPFDGCR